MSPRIRDVADLSELLGIAFSSEQLDAITAPLAPGVIIAGAGSGKTTVMAARVVWLVGTGQLTPEQVLGLTFTRKAAAELSARVRDALTRAGVIDPSGVDDSGEQLVLTYDAFASRLVTDHGLRIGVESDPIMITGASRFRLAAKVVTDAAGPFEHLARLRPDSITQRVLDLDGELASHLVSLDQIHAHARRFLRAVDEAPLNRNRTVFASLKTARAAAEERLELADLAAAYARLKREQGYVEFGDQMAVAARLAREIPAVSAALRHQFRVVLLDEYQDTSSAQAVLLRSLFSGESPETGLGHPVTAVGDPCQAIYGWRGAAASNITSFARDFPQRSGAPAARFALTVNRRSGPTILAAANSLAENLRRDPALAITADELALVAPEGTPPGDVTVASFETWAEEVRFIADQVVAAEASGQIARWSDIAVLVRRNAQIGQIYAELRRRDVPVEIVGLGGLLDVPEVVEVTSVLAVLEDADPNPALIRLLTSSRWAIGLPDLVLLGRRAAELAGLNDEWGEGLAAAMDRALTGTDPSVRINLVEAMDDPGEAPYSAPARQRFARFAGELRALRTHAAEPVLDLVHRVIATLGLAVELRSNGQGLEQVEAFVAAVGRYVDVDAEASLSGLMAYLASEREHAVGLDQAVVSTTDSVTLMTIHRAKGLEWELVLLPGLAQDVFPSLRVTSNWLRNPAALPSELRGDAAAIPQLSGEVTNAAVQTYEEDLKREAQFAEDRLAYVAVTRARRHLIASTHTWDAGLVRPRVPSTYLTALVGHGSVAAVAPPIAGKNPLVDATAPLAWPDFGDEELRARRRALAEDVRRARERGSMDESPTPLGADDASTVARWDSAFASLVREDSGSVRPQLPAYLTATEVVAASRAPEQFLSGRSRPMPRLVGKRQRQGIGFHRWLEQRFRLSPTLAPDDDDAWPLDDAQFKALTAAFERGQFASRRPTAVEQPFAMLLGETLVRGRIDAVFTDGDRWLVVDWKTGALDRADPLQLAVYRIAWAELAGVAPDQVDAAFFDIPPAVWGVAGGVPARAARGPRLRRVGRA